MELTREELDSLPDGKNIKRLNVFTGPMITDVNDPAQRKRVLDEVIKSLSQIMRGEVEVLENFED